MANSITFYGKISLKIPNFAIYGKCHTIYMANAITFYGKCLTNAMFFYSK